MPKLTCETANQLFPNWEFSKRTATATNTTVGQGYVAKKRNEAGKVVRCLYSLTLSGVVGEVRFWCPQDEVTNT